MSLLTDSSTVHVEVRFHNSEQRMQTLQAAIEPKLKAFLESSYQLPRNVSFEPRSDPALDTVKSILLEKDNDDSGVIGRPHNTYCYHYYMTQPFESNCGLFDNANDTDDIDCVVAASHILLPSNELVGLWENLIFEKGLKERLLKFALSALNFSQRSVNTNVISCNRLLLLHGPPGTGKTSLCKALIQKLAIRTNSYAYTHLVEINSHSLFSKWFSESGKLVARLFAKIGELVADKNNLVCVLIDEVESLAYARSAMSNNEPRDAMRVVNAVLTQLDEIKINSNVLVFATSNLAQSIDLAFLDRADVRQYIGLPNVPAVCSIYKSMLMELMSTGIVQTESLESGHADRDMLLDLAKRSVGLSGRTLRKMPLLAYVEITSNGSFNMSDKIHMADFLDAMMIALKQHLKDQELLNQPTL